MCRADKPTCLPMYPNPIVLRFLLHVCSPPSHLSTKHPHSIKPNHLLYYSLEP